MASTYVNDLRLNEMATGDQSGSWGTVTNTNLELIAEAFSFGTEGITTNADTHTTTIADGATDPGRSMFLKYTGTLDSACTITIAPNTVSKLWFIENATSGSQNIIIKQGSGATITIPPGDTKAIYSDGAGSGGKMVDAFASLSVVDLKVQDDLTVTDDAAIGGTLGVTGIVTANAGVVVDEMTLDADTLTATDTFTIDAAGDITLDADGADIRLSDAGTQFGKFTNSSSDFVISSSVNDKDMIFKGADGGADITALTLDMSQAGRATFNEGIVAGTSTAGAFGLTLNTASGDNMTLSVADTGSGGAALGTISVSDGGLTLDSASTITLDADNAAIALKDGGVQVGSINMTSSDLQFVSEVSDKDMKFTGNDGGSFINALTLDMSDAGSAIFNNAIYLNADLIHTGDTDTQFQFSGANEMRLIAGNVETFKTTASEVSVNDQSADVDFRVESNGNTHALFVDAGNDGVGIFNSADTSLANLAVGLTGVAIAGDTDGATIGKGGIVRLVNGNNFSTTDATVMLLSGGTGGSVGQISSGFGFARHSDSTWGTQIKMYVHPNDTVDLDELHEAARVSPTEFIINETSNDYDFRVESANNANCLFLDASANVVNFGTTDTSVAGNTGSARGVNVNSSGYIEVAAYQDPTAYFNRMNNDGTVIEIRQNGSTEGTISVSGSTVSYNGFAGRHESSGIATSTARGTVVSTIDELDVYPDLQNTPNGGTKPNPKAGQARADHAKVKVSDSVGDARVYGVVDDFDENDKLFVISVGIASVKVTGSCSGGDLLESNGDGTAKVQSDDIVRSKTIGKVTIGNSNTGVKLVSCVMYCG